MKMKFSKQINCRKMKKSKEIISFPSQSVHAKTTAWLSAHSICSKILFDRKLNAV
jgi:hypothetical protein